jgi:hypothetical protein
VCFFVVAARSGAQPQPAPGNRDAASAGSRVAAADLPALKCHLGRREPVLDYEFRFTAPFWVRIPLRLLHGGGRRLSSTTLIHPISIEGAETVRLEDAYVLGEEVPEGMSGELWWGNALALGEGLYKVDWRIEDEAGRSCELSWTLEAKLPRRRRVDLTLKPGEAMGALVSLFRPEPAAEKSGTALRVKVLMNLDTQSRRRALVNIWQYVPMISGLRVMSRHPALAEFTVVAFSLAEQRVLHRQQFSREINFPKLGDAIDSLKPAMVEVENLRPGSDLEFLDVLLARELNDIEQVDAIIFVGADDRFGMRVSPETLEWVRTKDIPVFHFNSTPYLWRGAIGNTVRSLGGTEYKVRQPHELVKAVDQLVAEILANQPQ